MLDINLKKYPIVDGVVFCNNCGMLYFSKGHKKAVPIKEAVEPEPTFESGDVID